MSREEVKTPGRELLKAWVSERDRGSQAKLAERLGVSEQLISQWRSGACRPGSIYRDALEAATGIEPHQWETDKEREQRKRALTGPAPVAATDESEHREPKQGAA
jgi:transcriptional regulator with XRE-family HTH domain